MEEKNVTWQNYFIIRGITDSPQLQAPIFLQVLLIYLIILIGNSSILLLICTDPQLQKPMYHFLSHLSIMDVCYSTVTMHKTLDTYVSGNKQVSFSACIAQMYFYVALLCCEFLLLTAMSYDRYVAICIPLRYVMIMNKKMCTIMTTLCWIVGFLEVLPAAIIVYRIYCFKSNDINHFFCDLLAIMKLLCHSVSNMERLIYVESVFVGFLPFSLTIMSYIYIIRAILRIHSSTGSWKAFYTCSSHITVVSLLYVTIFCLYMRPTSAFTLESDKLFSLFYTALTPMLNPLIYSLKNKDVKLALYRLMAKNNKISF
ncbi:PREDICTED: olfactory receptor 1009-like [Nanorana parkeri]|uniref:olfactory receptor 1009-like n=1 Tax=Nanorana parkeri TaxID=125878 RepID=UPI000854FFE4|nr:PREDICTED: olfactory receptor 1009-like [Nanorana parkeri]